MGNLRRVKKNIKALCGDIANECIIAGTFFPGADQEKLADVVYGAAQLQTRSIRKLSVSFDKAPRDFANRADYRKARRKYYKEVIAAIDTLFFKEAESLVATMNNAAKKGKE